MFVGVVLRFLLGLVLAAGAPSTTSPTTFDYDYDAPVVTRADVQQIAAATVLTDQRSSVSDGPASPSVEAGDTSTTPYARSVATNTADDIIRLGTSAASARSFVGTNSAGGLADDTELVRGGINTPDRFASYVYGNDLVGNRVSNQVAEGGVITAFAHDADGNLSGVGWDVFRFDSQSCLVGSTVGGVVSSQVFDGDGLRVMCDGDQVGWDRVHGRPVSVGSTALGFGPSGVVSERSATGVWFGLSDVSGTPRTVSDGSGRVVGSTSFGVWGDTRSSSGVGSLVGFQGGLSDTASSVGFGARSYLPQYGSWAQPDPLQPNASGTQGWLLYGFVGNNPSTFTDTSGLSEFVECAHVQVLRASAWFGLSGSFGACVTRGLVEAGVVGVGAGVGVGPVDVAATGLSCGLAAGNGKRNVPDVPDDPAPTTRTSPTQKRRTGPLCHHLGRLMAARSPVRKERPIWNRELGLIATAAPMLEVSYLRRACRTRTARFVLGQTATRSMR